MDLDYELEYERNIRNKIADLSEKRHMYWVEMRRMFEESNDVRQYIENEKQHTRLNERIKSLISELSK